MPVTQQDNSGQHCELTHVAGDSKVLVVSAAHVGDLLASRIPFHAILRSQWDVFVALEAHQDGPPAAEAAPPSLPTIDAPLRTPLRMPHHTGLFMPARFHSDTTCKIVSVPAADALSSVKKGLPAATVVLDGDSGRIRAMVQAAKLTAVRTAAGSALSVMVMHSQSCFAGRAPRHITVFGGGAQGVFHAAHLYALFRNARCDARSGAIHIDFVTRSSWADEERAAKKLIMQHAGTRAVVIGHVLSNDRTSVESSTRSAEIIVTCTSSSEPLFDDDWVQPGAHLVLIGSYKPHMQEVNEETVRRARGRLLVDSIEACSAEAGDLIKAGLRPKDCIALGKILSTPPFCDWDLDIPCCETSSEHDRGAAETLAKLNHDTARADKQISMFKSVGVGVQDVAITSLVVQAAIENNVGQWIDFF